MTDHGLLDLDRWTKGVPFDDFERMRAESPVLLHDNPNGRDFWAITGHAEVVSASRDSQHFHASPNNSIADMIDTSAGESAHTQMLHMLNGKAHTRQIGRAHV